MLAAKLNATRSGLDLVEIEEPRPAAGECLIEVAACGICASDLRFLAGKGEAMPGTTLGHEATGTVVACGEGVEPDLQGRAVAIDPLVGCGDCPTCAAGLANRCPDRGFLGIHRDGSFAERVVAPAANLVPLPDGVDLFSAALTEPLSVARHALGPEQAASVAVIGSGGIGLGAIVIARARGARRVLAIDVSATALGHAEACGAETLLVGEPIESAAFEQVLECTGAPGTLGLAAELAAPGGEVAMVGIGGGEDFPAEAFVRNELRARGAFAYLYEEVVEVAQGISAGDLSVGGIGPEAAPLAEIMAAVERLRAEPGAHPRIIVQPRDGVRAPAQVRR